MQVVLGGREWDVVANDPGATVADLAVAADVPVDSLVGVRGVRSAPLVDAGIVRGGVLDEAPERSDAPASIAVVGGLDAGRRAPFVGGRVVLGRGDGADVVLADATVSRRHAELTVDDAGAVALRDLASRNGTWVASSVDCEEALSPGALEPLGLHVAARLGATEIAVETAVDDAPIPGPSRRSTIAGTVPHNRPPRPALPPPTPAVEAPEPPSPPGPGLPLGVVAVLAPLLMAGVMVVVLGNPVFAIFALLSPVLAVGGHVESKRRATKGRRRDATRWSRDLAELRAALGVAVDAELLRRRSIHADPAEVARRAEQPSTRLWERRHGHDDWLVLRAGTGPVPWDVPIAGPQTATRHPDVLAAVADAAFLARCPATVDLSAGGVVGIVGARSAALAVGRALVVQAAVHHGPADLPVLVAADAAAADDWDWAKWLPHVTDPSGAGRRLAAGRVEADGLADALLQAARERDRLRHPGDERGRAPTLLCIVDGDSLLDGRRAPLRSVLGGAAGPVAGIVVAPTVDRLPAVCSSIVVLDGDAGDGEIRLPAVGRRVGPIRAGGIAAATARRTARALACFDDPELDGGAAGLPDVVRLLPLLGLDDPTPAAVARRWADAGADPRPVTPLGVAVDGVLELDLVADGPHGLVAGTTGAGKSELLRTFVAGLAAGADPDHLTFVLVDFKGGSAFDACARLPHTVGLVTDLDADLAERALRCLEAELRHRERLLRAAGAADLAGYRRVAGTDASLPRLVVVVDEFATLKAELPDFVDALVGIAQRGRSLGVHLVLATQRPAGAVSDHLRANANLRIALRVQDPGDSTDVVDVPDAATLPRHRPGRACVRLGPGEVVAVQTALVTASASASVAPVELRPFTFGSGIVLPTDAAGNDAAGPSDLDRLVDACAGAWAATGRPPPRRPWPDPLPSRLAEADLVALLDTAPDDALVAVAVADEPDRQRRVPAGWRPTDGNLAVFGVGGSGTTTTLVALAVELARSRSPESLHLYAVDHGAGELAVLAGLPHCGAVVAAGERERQHRLVRQLRRELERRRSTPSAERAGLPEIVVLLDGAAGFLAGLDDIEGIEILESFERVFADGPEVGIRCVVTADRGAGLRSSLAALVRQRWVHRLADPMEAGLLGLSGSQPALPPGRYVDAVTGLVAQIATPASGWPAAVAAAAARWAPAGGGPAGANGAPPRVPAVVRTLPAEIDRSVLATACTLGTERPWTIPIGVADDDLAPIALPLWDGDHVLVAGPARSGRTTVLATIARAVLTADAAVVVLALAGRRSWLDRVEGVRPVGSPGALAAAVDAARDTPTFVLVDDAESVDEPDGALDRLAGDAQPGLHVVAAGRAEVVRGLYHHWTKTVRRSRLGVLLRPNLDLDGDLLGTTLPRRVGVPLVPGRGFVVVDGTPRLAQLALPT